MESFAANRLATAKKLKASKDYLGKGLALFLYKKMNEITNACIEGNPLSDNYRNVQFNQHCGYSIVQSRCYMTRFSESLK